MTAVHPRPRVVDVAFWSWLVAAVFLVIGGVLPQLLSFATVRNAAAPTVSDQQIHSWLLLHKGAGVVGVLLGLAVGYLAGRTRRGDKRFRRATVTLSLAVVALLALGWLAAVVTIYALPAIIALIVAVGLITRPNASAWFDEVNGPEGGDA